MRQAIVVCILVTLAALPIAAQTPPLAAPSIGATYGNITAAAAAASGTVYLVAWTESRQGLAQVRGIHVNVDGSPIEASSFPISAASDANTAGTLSAPVVASDGTNFLVVWGANSRLRTALVPPSGPIRRTTTNIDALSIAVVWSGSGYVVLHLASTGTIAFTLLDANGQPFRSAVPIAASATGINSVTLAANRSGRILGFWIADGNAHLADLSGDPTATGRIIATTLDSPRTVRGPGTLASDGKEFLAVWSTDPATPQGDNLSIFARGLDETGNVKGPIPVPVQEISAAAPPLVRPMLTWNGANWILITSGANDIEAIELDIDGAPLTPFYTVTSFSSHKDAVALLGGTSLFSGPKSNLFLVWRDFRLDHAQLFGQPTDIDAAANAGEILVSRAIANQNGQASVWTGSDYLGVWLESGAVTSVIAARAREHTPIHIADARGAGGNLKYATVAAAGGKSVIIWLDLSPQTAIKTTIFRSTLLDGSNLASPPQAITTDITEDQPSIATDGQTFAIAWTTATGEIAITTIDATGFGSAVPITVTVKPANTLYYSSPRLAWIGNGYALARLRTINVGPTIVEVQRLSPALTPIGSPVALSDTDRSDFLAIAGRSGEALVTWIQGTPASSTARAYRMLFPVLDGLPPPPQPPPLQDPFNGIALATNPSHAPTAAWDGTSWWVGVDNRFFVLPPTSGAPRPVQTLTAGSIVSIATGGPRPFVLFDVYDPAEIASTVHGNLLDEARRRSVRH
ncbi:MAG TPA: hypothetical protein VGQ46_22670 [Thermoanaerobaculia bacterium]|jgi:hypothetical protein|nr:hypothetical protein [Thermoanaerobaculia bacterium]